MSTESIALALIPCGTESSNPAPSSGESGANSRSPRRLQLPRRLGSSPHPVGTGERQASSCVRRGTCLHHGIGRMFAASSAITLNEPPQWTLSLNAEALAGAG
jgi:hypothetical protein